MTIISRVEVRKVDDNSAQVRCRTNDRCIVECLITDDLSKPLNDWGIMSDPRKRRSHRFNWEDLTPGTTYHYTLRCDGCEKTDVQTFATTGSTPGPVPPTPTPTDFVMDTRYFDGDGGQYGIWEDDPKLDITGPKTFLCWFRRDVFNLQQFLLSKGHWGDRIGWRYMIKQTKPPYQYEQIQFDVGDGRDLNYYKTLQGVTDSKDHFTAFVFNPDKIYTDSKGVDTHGFLQLDGDPDKYYMARSGDTLISRVKPYRREMYVGRHFCEGKFYFAGMIYFARIIDDDIGKDGTVDFYNRTKHLYNV
ncbi:hypothetical protein CW696_06800 [ANME-2 cluster archaeon]|nr:MAG: hypothetical protein CW696_06800 [ANME-2 cluster archaeon]